MIILKVMRDKRYNWSQIDEIRVKKVQIKGLLDDPEYLAQTASLLFGAWSYLPLWSDEQRIRKRLLNRNADDNQQPTLVAVDSDNNVIGTGSIIHYELNNDPQRVHWLGEIVTKSSHRGQGVASTLIKHFMALAAERGITELWLYTPDQQSLYRKLGWQDREQLMVTGESVTVMVLQLNDKPKEYELSKELGRLKP